MSDVLIFSKNTLFRNYLVDFVKGFDGIESVSCVKSLMDIVHIFEQKCPDFVVADVYSRNNGDDVVGFLSKHIDSNKIVIITTEMNKQLNFYENVYGITKFVYSDETEEEIYKAFCTAFSGTCSCHDRSPSILTPRECEILKMIATGKTSKEIAEDLCISKNTVDTHRNKMLQKLNMANSVSLVQFAYSSGLI